VGHDLCKNSWRVHGDEARNAHHAIHIKM